jgi:hypothetical protein
MYAIFRLDCIWACNPGTQRYLTRKVATPCGFRFVYSVGTPLDSPSTVLYVEMPKLVSMWRFPISVSFNAN